MKAVGFKKFGDSSVLELLSVAIPEPKVDEVVIKIHYTSVNPVDYKIREGYLQSHLPHKFPIVSGWDAAGEISAVGANVEDFSVGDRVYAYTRLPEIQNGTYAEFIALPSTFAAKVPASIGLDAAAATPLVALTAYQALHEVAKVKPNDKVLITGGAGGVGSFAVQFANLIGADVATTTSSRNITYVKELGAKHVIDYKNESLVDAAKRIAPNGFDVIFDAVGGETLRTSETLLSVDGRLVSIVDTPAKGSYHFVYPNGSQLKEIAKLFDANKLQTPSINTLSVRDAAKAQDESAGRGVRGKLVLKIDF